MGMFARLEGRWLARRGAHEDPIQPGRHGCQSGLLDRCAMGPAGAARAGRARCQPDAKAAVVETRQHRLAVVGFGGIECARHGDRPVHHRTGKGFLGGNLAVARTDNAADADHGGDRGRDQEYDARGVAPAVTGDLHRRVTSGVNW